MPRAQCIDKAALDVLTGTGHLCAVQEEAVTASAKANSDKLNLYLTKKARGNNDIGFLVSPVTGGGVGVNRFEQLFLLAISQNKKEPIECAQMVWQILSAQGQNLIKDGKTLESKEENIAELTAEASVFIKKQLPVLKALQIA